MISRQGVSSSELPSIAAFGATAKQRRRQKGQLVWVDLGARVRLCSAPPHQLCHSQRRLLSREYSFSPYPTPAEFCAFSPPWMMCHISPNPRPNIDPRILLRPHLQISEVGRERHYLSLEPWASHSPSLVLCVPSIKWRRTVLPRVSPPITPLLKPPYSTSKEPRAQGVHILPMVTSQ